MALLPQLPVLTAKSAQLLPLFRARHIGTSAAVPISLPDPGVNRRDTGLELPREVLGTSSGSMQLDDLLPESRRVRVPCSWHLNTFPLQSKGVHETGGTPRL